MNDEQPERASTVRVPVERVVVNRADLELVLDMAEKPRHSGWSARELQALHRCRLEMEL